MYENYCKIRDSKGLRDSDVAKGSGLNPQIFVDWKRKKGTPKSEKLLAIANYLEVPIEYLITGEMPSVNARYFLDDETALMAQKMHDDEDIRILFDGVQKISREDLQFVIDLVKRMDKQNG